MSKKTGNVAVATVRTFYEIWRSRNQKSEIAAEIGFWNELLDAQITNYKTEGSN